MPEEPVIAISEDDLRIPASMLAESFDPEYQFNWQNPALEATIYPFRKAKLIDFLAFFAEIDLVRQNKNKDENDPGIKALITQFTDEITRERAEVEAQLSQRVAERQAADKWFRKISHPDIKIQRWRQAYYLDREIDRLQSQLDAQLEQQKSLLKRLDWYPDDPDDPEDTEDIRLLKEQHKQMWRDRAAELNPCIRLLRSKLKPVVTLRALCERIAELPDVSKAITKSDVMRIQMRAKRKSWESLDEQKILRLIIDQINANPDRYPEWLVYMVIHFSGMRYVSAHGSWADPCYLLQALQQEDEVERVNTLKDTELAAECLQLVNELKQNYDPTSSDKKQKDLGILIQRLGQPGVQRTVLRTYRIDQIVSSEQPQTDDKPCLDGLVQYRKLKEGTPDCIPDWAWNEIVKYTPLRLNTDNPTWEAFSPERWTAKRQHWTQVLNDWERKDITSWRKKHHDSLELVVIRSVCNELAEQIQDLRGLTPVGGLTSRPVWYLRMAAKNPLRAYLRQAPGEADFRPGASILFLQWMEQKPSPWQVAHPLSGYNLIPSENKPVKPGMRGEVRKNDLINRDDDEEGGWSSKPVGDGYIRTRPRPEAPAQRPTGKPSEKAHKKKNRDAIIGKDETQYLRWRHEATVVGVLEMITGKFVMTFETGQIGIILRRLDSLAGSPMVFVGYMPDLLKNRDEMEKDLADKKEKLADMVAKLAGLAALQAAALQKQVDACKKEVDIAQGLLDMDQKLVNMLDWGRILPGANLPKRVRPKKMAEPGDPGSTDDTPRPGELQREVLVIHGERSDPRGPIKCRSFTITDKQGRPKFTGANPPVMLARGMKLGVSKIAKESANDSGNGIIHGADGLYLKITACQDQPKAVGLYIHVDHIADFSAGQWVQMHPDIPRTNPQVLDGYDIPGKPYFAPLPMAERPKAQILPGKDFHFRVSTNHKECFLDLSDGLINSSGRVNTYYLILECPKVPAANGLFVETEEIIPEAVLQPPKARSETE
jgi:hypothetical protein